MKPYFAKYLPVEGKGDENCKWQWNNNIKNTGWEDITPSDMDAIIAHGLNPSPEFRKLKLFLCSRDIQVGDKPWSKRGHQLKDEIISDIEGKTLSEDGWYKVIGEISLEATWVKEGDEFISEGKDCEVFPYHEHDNEGKIVYTNKLGIPIDNGFPIYLIKGPCGHFH